MKWSLVDSSVYPASNPEEHLLNIRAAAEDIDEGNLKSIPRTRSSLQPVLIDQVVVYHENAGIVGGVVSLDQDIVADTIDAESLSLLLNFKRITTTAYLTLGGPAVHPITASFDRSWRDAVNFWVSEKAAESAE